MKKLLLTVSLVAASAVASWSQGLVSIALNGGSLISTNGPYSTGLISGSSAFYFELLISSDLGLVGTTANDILSNPSLLSLWTDSGVSGVNGTGLNAGKIISGSSVAAAGWEPPGVTFDNPMAYIIVGWSANYGTMWSEVASLLQGSGLPIIGIGYFGTTVVAQNYAGGGAGALPAVNLWGNMTGTPGFGITTTPYLSIDIQIPEPSTMALAGLGGLSLWLLRRRK